MSILSVMFPSGLSQLFWWQRTLEFTIRVLIESHKKLSKLYVVKLKWNNTIDQKSLVFLKARESLKTVKPVTKMYFIYLQPLFPQNTSLFIYTPTPTPQKSANTNTTTKWSFCLTFFAPKIFSFFSRKVFNGQYPPNFPIWERATSPKMRLPSIARSHFCAAEPGKVWHLLVITRHIFKLWKCGLGAQPGMNMIGEEDYKTRNARSFLFWPGWLNLSCLFEYHELKCGQWHIW